VVFSVELELWFRVKLTSWLAAWGVDCHPRWMLAHKVPASLGSANVSTHSWLLIHIYVTKHQHANKLFISSRKTWPTESPREPGRATWRACKAPRSTTCLYMRLGRRSRQLIEGYTHDLCRWKETSHLRWLRKKELFLFSAILRTPPNEARRNFLFTVHVSWSWLRTMLGLVNV